MTSGGRKTNRRQTGDKPETMTTTMTMTTTTTTTDKRARPRRTFRTKGATDEFFTGTETGARRKELDGTKGRGGSSSSSSSLIYCTIFSF